MVLYTYMLIYGTNYGSYLIITKGNMQRRVRIASVGQILLLAVRTISSLSNKAFIIS
jgi:hypothetical protein